MIISNAIYENHLLVIFFTNYTFQIITTLNKNNLIYNNKLNNFKINNLK